MFAKIISFFKWKIIQLPFVIQKKFWIIGFVSLFLSYDYWWSFLYSLSIKIQTSSFWYGKNFHLKDTFYWNVIDKNIPFIKEFIIPYVFIFFVNPIILIFICMKIYLFINKKYLSTDARDQFIKLTNDFIWFVFLFTGLEFFIWIFIPIKVPSSEVFYWIDNLKPEDNYYWIFKKWFHQVESRVGIDPSSLGNALPSNHFFSIYAISLFLYQSLKIQQTTKIIINKNNLLYKIIFHGKIYTYTLLIISIFCTLIVSFSIFFTKQHYLIDAIVTYILGFGFWKFIRSRFKYSGNLLGSWKNY
jgi:hypothetical protein